MIIAVVDDDEAILDAVRMVLEAEGWNVQTYATGEAFLTDHNRDKLDCIILDPHLPILSGAEVARSLAKTDSHIPIIGLTARPGSLMANEVTKSGARVMLTKPVSSEALIHHVRALINDVS